MKYPASMSSFSLIRAFLTPGSWSPLQPNSQEELQLTEGCNQSCHEQPQSAAAGALNRDLKQVIFFFLSFFLFLSPFS